MTSRFIQSRKAEIDYHEQLYRHTPLFSPGSWLAKPATSVISAVQLINDKPLTILDLGCGVGRNSIPLAQQALAGSKVVCIDLLETAMCCSCLEHLSSEQIFLNKIMEIKNATKSSGIVCILLNTDVVEEDMLTGEVTPSLLELNLKSDETFQRLENCFHNWKLIKKSTMQQSMKELKDGKEIILSGNWIAYITQNV